MRSVAATSPFVGREVQIAALLGALDDSCCGPTMAVFVSGEAGVGKTRLLTEFCVLVEARAVPVLSAAAVDLGEGAPFWPVRQALGGYLRDSRYAELHEAVRPWSSRLGPLLSPTSGGGSPPSMPSSGTLDFLIEFIGQLAARTPIVLMLEDMHWADRSTRHFLSYLLAGDAGQGILLVTTYRVDATQESHPLRLLLYELQRKRRVQFIELQPLNRAAVQTLVSSAVGDAADSQLVDFIYARSGGNAFFVEEILRSVYDGRVDGVPADLQEVVRARIATVPRPTQRVLQAMSIADEPVPHQLLAAVLTMSAQTLNDALRSAVTAAAVTVDAEGNCYRLRHGIVKDVIANDLLPGERIYWHRRYGEVLQSPQFAHLATPAQLASHWDRAESRGEALTATVRAAEDAERLFGFAEAHRHWQRATELFDPAGAGAGGIDKPTLLERAAQAAHCAGEHDAAVTLLRAQLTSQPDDGEVTAQLYDRLGRYHLAAGHAGHAVQAHRNALAALPDRSPPQVRSVILAGYADTLLAVGRHAEALEQSELALASCQLPPLGGVRGQILPTLGYARAYLGDLTGGLSAVSEGLRIAEADGDPTSIAAAHLDLCKLLTEPLNRLPDGIDAAKEGISRASQLGLRRTYGVRLQALLANALFRIGDWAEAAAVIEAALAERPTGAAAIELRLARCRVLLAQGQLDDAEQELILVESRSTETASLSHQVSLLTLRAGLAMWRGRPDLARGYVRIGLNALTDASDDIWLLAPLLWHGARAEAEDAVLNQVYSRQVDSDRTEWIRQQLPMLAEAAQTAAPGLQASLLGYLELCEGELTRALGQSEPASWARAIEIWELNGHPYPAAYARLRLAEALFSERARAAGAEKALQAAHASTAALGALPLLSEIGRLANRAGIPLSRAPKSLMVPPMQHVSPPNPKPRQEHRDLGAAFTGAGRLASLTMREISVLQEVAEGRSNRQIARQLFISEKTVSVHVSHILAKLGVRTRVQAAALMYRVSQLSPSEEQPE